jgi:hypothetical protein
MQPAFIELVVFVEVRPDDTYRTQKQPRGAQQWVISTKVTLGSVLYILTFFGPARDTDPPAIVGSVLRFRTPEFTGAIQQVLVHSTALQRATTHGNRC